MFRNKFLLLFLLLFYFNTITIVHAVMCNQIDLCLTGDSLPVYHKSDPKPPNQARYDFARVYVMILKTKLHLDVMQELEKSSNSIIFPIYPKFVAQKINVLVPGSKIAHFEDILFTFQFIAPEITCYNFQTKIDENFEDVKGIDTDPNDFDWEHYFELETIYAWMDSIVEKYPKIASIIDIGNSSEHYQMKGIKLNFGIKCADKDGPDTKTTVVIESGIHAREWVSPAAATFIINEFLTSNSTAIKKISHKFHWIIFPVINPDGYKYSFTTDRLWIKNRRLFGSCRGVDLNRNFPYLWEKLNRHRDACADDYAGPHKASEIETVNLKTYLEIMNKVERIRTYISLHSYAQLITFPFSAMPNKSKEYDYLHRIGQIVRLSKGKNVYGVGSMYGTGTPMSGTSLDWVHGMLGVPVTYMIEIRGNVECKDNYLLPGKEIESASSDALDIILEILKHAENVGYYKPLWKSA